MIREKAQNMAENFVRRRETDAQKELDAEQANSELLKNTQASELLKNTQANAYILSQPLTDRPKLPR